MLEKSPSEKENLNGSIVLIVKLLPIIWENTRKGNNVYAMDSYKIVPVYVFM